MTTTITTAPISTATTTTGVDALTEQMSWISCQMPTTEIKINRNLLRLDWVRDWSDIVVAGGHVLNAILDDREASEAGDIDIFFVSPSWGEHSKLDASAKIVKIHGWLQEYYGMAPIIRATSMTITMYLPNAYRSDKVAYGREDKRNGLKVQIITGYVAPDVYTLLHAFDLNNCQFAIKAGKVFATERAIKYLRDKTIEWYDDPTLNAFIKQRLLVRRQKYFARTYNKTVKLSYPPVHYSKDMLMDYTNEEKSMHWPVGVPIPDCSRNYTIEEVKPFMALYRMASNC